MLLLMVDLAVDLLNRAGERRDRGRFPFQLPQQVVARTGGRYFAALVAMPSATPYKRSFSDTIGAS